MNNTDQKMANGVQAPSKTSKTYTEKQVIQLLELKDQTIRWLNSERYNLSSEVAELQNRTAKINEALTLIQGLTASHMDLAVFEKLSLQ